jgi:TonB family protein
MFANDRDTKGVAGSYGISLFIHLLVLLFFFSYIRQKNISMEGYKLTEVTVIEEMPETAKPLSIEKPRNILDFIRQSIPVSNASRPALNSIPVIKPLKQEVNPSGPAPINMDKTAPMLSPGLKTIELSPEIGRTRLDPALLRQSITPLRTVYSIPDKSGRISLNASARPIPVVTSGRHISVSPGQGSPRVITADNAIRPPAAETNKRRKDMAADIPQKQSLLIMGDAAGRRLIISKKPFYPGWAQDSGITAMVVIFFTVAPDGTVRPTASVDRTSGYPELDSLAREALLEFRFEPLKSGQDQTGYASFRYTLE